MKLPKVGKTSNEISGCHQFAAVLPWRNQRNNRIEMAFNIKEFLNDMVRERGVLRARFGWLRVLLIAELDRLNIMNLATPESAILSAVIFNALIIVALVPVALRGVRYRPIGADGLLRRNMLIYGLGGIIVPFIGIKLIDMLLELVKFP